MLINTKFFITFTLTLILIFGTSIYINKYFKTSTSFFNENLIKLESSIKNNKFDNSTALISDIDSNWKSTRNTWALFIDHFEIDSIEESIIKTRTFINTNNKMMALPELYLLKEKFSHIYDKEKLSLKNIL